MTKKKKPSITQLKRKAWTLFSLAIRYRDSEWLGGEWLGRCITCDRLCGLKDAQAGHFISRRYNATLFNEENVNLQCRACNVLFHGEQYKYGIAIDNKYGDGTAAKLMEEAKASHRFTAAELEQIMADAQTEIDFYQRTEEKTAPS